MTSNALCVVVRLPESHQRIELLQFTIPLVENPVLQLEHRQRCFISLKRLLMELAANCGGNPKAH